MPTLGQIHYPNVTFLNLNTKKHVTVDVSRHTAQLKSTKRTRGTGKMYRIEAVKDGQKLSRILGEADYNMLKTEMASSRQGTRSGKAARRGTRSGKAARRGTRSGKRTACNKKKSAACKQSTTCTYIRKSTRNKSYCRSRA